MERLQSMKDKQLEKLVAKAIRGNGDAFTEIVKLKTNSIYFKAFSILHQRQDAEDATQEVILKIHKYIKKLKDPGMFNAWLQKITIHHCYEMENKKKMKVEIVSMDERFEDMVEDDREFLPQSYAESREQRLIIRDLISKLPEQKKQIVTMFYFDELSYNEISYALDVPVGTVASDLTRSKKIIREKLEQISPVNNIGIQKNSKISVLTAVFAEQAREEVPGSIVKNMTAYSEKIVASGKHLNALSLIKFVGIALFSTIIVTTGILFVVSNVEQANHQATPTGPAISENQEIEEQSSMPELNGEIIFKKNGKASDYENPEKIEISTNDDYNNINWTITNNDTDQHYTGSGKTYNKKLRSITSAGKKGLYTIAFTINYDYGNLKLDRDFIIN